MLDKKRGYMVSFGIYRKVYKHTRGGIPKMKRYINNSNEIIYTLAKERKLSKASQKFIKYYSSKYDIDETVRKDSRLKNTHRLLLSDLINLAKKFGFCFASNNYLAKMHHVSKRTITRWLGVLRKLEYITIEIIKKPDNEILERRIHILPVESEESKEMDSIKKCIIEAFEEKDVNDNISTKYSYNIYKTKKIKENDMDNPNDIFSLLVKEISPTRKIHSIELQPYPLN